MSSVLQQAQAEKLTLLAADNKAGYFGVHLAKPGQPKPYQAWVWRGGKTVFLGYFATAEEAALCVARSPEGRAAAAERAAAAAPPTSEEARQQAQAEKVTLLVAKNRTGYFGVYLSKPGRSKPYKAQVKRGGKTMYLDSFATAEEAALCVARSPEGQAAAAERAAAATPLTSEEAWLQAQAERLTLLVAENKAGYFGVHLSKPGQPSKPYQAQVWRGGKKVSLGCFAAAEEAALHVARTPEGRAAAAERAAAAVPLTSEEARQQAQADELTLLVAKNKTGYFGVRLDKPGLPKPYQARVTRSGKQVSLGSFATAEEAALCVARTPEGRAAAGRAAAAKSQGALPAVLSGASLKEEGTVPPMPPGAFVKGEGVVPPMPPDAFVKMKPVVKDEEGSTDGRPKRQRTK
jgi:predicted secreted protein